jgi:hypothetical protein
MLGCRLVDRIAAISYRHTLWLNPEPPQVHTSIWHKEGKAAKLFVMTNAHRSTCYLFMQGTGRVHTSIWHKEGKAAKLVVLTTAHRSSCYLFMQGTGWVHVSISHKEGILFVTTNAHRSTCYLFAQGTVRVHVSSDIAGEFALINHSSVLLCPNTCVSYSP